MCLSTGQFPGWLCSMPCPPSASDFRCQLQGPYHPLSSISTLGWSLCYKQGGESWEERRSGSPQDLPIVPVVFAPKVSPLETWVRSLPHHNCDLHPDSAT